MRRKISSALLLLAALGMPGALLAQADQLAGATNGKTVHIVRTGTPPVIDGRLDDEVWGDATFIDDLRQIRPVEYAEPSERTEIYLLYDDNAIYVAARMYIAEEDMTANVLRRGQGIIVEDNFHVHFGPFNDKRSGFFFGVNPNGVRNDGIFQNVSQPYDAWSTIFSVETGRFEGGWTAEFEIPFKSLSFDSSAEVWGLNFTRSIESRNEMVAWQSLDRRFDPSSYGEMTGISNVNQGVGLDITPSVSTGSSRRYSSSGSDTSFEPSLDLVYKLTPSLNGSLTFNTDFSATEVDNRQVNLTRFSLFFPEKRSFFLTEADIFEFGRIGANNGIGSGQNGRPFFSRNIGLSNTGQAVDLNYGAKVSGRVGNFDVGALSIRQDDFGTVDAATLSVARVNASVLDESTIGFIATDGDPHSNLDNSLLGVDFLYRNPNLSGNRMLEISTWYQQSDTEGVNGDDAASGISFSMPNSNGFSGGVAMRRFESNFNPALGFVNRRGVRDLASEFGYTYRPRGGFLQAYDFNLNGRRYEYLDGGGLQSQQITLDPFYLTARTGDVLFWRSNFNKEVLLTPFEISDGVIIPVGEYDFYNHGIELRTASFREVSVNFTYIRGTFYTGDQNRYFGDIEWQPSPKFSASLSYDLNYVDLPEGRFTTRLLSSGINYVFSNRLSWVNLLQYDNVSETLGLNMRLHWVPEEGQEFFFVINQLMEDYDRDNRFHSAFTDATAKFSYTFRF